MPLSLLIVTFLVGANLSQSLPRNNWCMSGVIRPEEGPFRSLGDNAILPILERYLQQNVELLRRRPLVLLSPRQASRLTGVDLKASSGEVFFMARAGVVGAPALTIHQYLANRGVARTFLGSISANGKKLMITTSELSPPYPPRQFAVVVKAPRTVETASAGCITAQ